VPGINKVHTTFFGRVGGKRTGFATLSSTMTCGKARGKHNTKKSISALNKQEKTGNHHWGKDGILRAGKWHHVVIKTTQSVCAKGGPTCN